MYGVSRHWALPVILSDVLLNQRGREIMTEILELFCVITVFALVAQLPSRCALKFLKTIVLLYFRAQLDEVNYDPINTNQKESMAVSLQDIEQEISQK